jgi:hypothetical protein
VLFSLPIRFACAAAGGLPLPYENLGRLVKTAFPFVLKLALPALRWAANFHKNKSFGFLGLNKSGLPEMSGSRFFFWINIAPCAS